MRIVRWVLAALVLLVALFEVMPAGQIAGYRLGWLAATTPDEIRMVPLMNATPWWMLIAWFVDIGVYLLAAVRLMRGQKAFLTYLLGFAINLAAWTYYSRWPVYQQVFSPAELRSDYVIFAVIAAIGAAIFVAERRRPA